MRTWCYDPWLGRLLSADSVVPEVGEAQALNRYTYVQNNPLRYTDPAGQCDGHVEGERKKRKGMR